MMICWMEIFLGPLEIDSDDVVKGNLEVTLRLKQKVGLKIRIRRI